MRIKQLNYLYFFLFCSLLIAACGTTTPSLIVTVNFGTPPKGGGPCSGHGVCSAVAQSAAPANSAPATTNTTTPTNDSANPNPAPAPAPAAVPADGTKVTMLISPVNKQDLVMTFSLSELTQKQPDQVQYFKDGGTYVFDGPYSLADQMYASLQLAPNPRIDQTSPGKVKIVGDVVTVTFTYAHD